jgi:hypothetical protein
MANRTVVLIVALMMVALLAGCAEYTEPQSEKTAAEPAAPASLEMTAELQTKLAGADLVDGEADQVVSNCPGCALAMTGSDQHALHVGEYDLHFCSDGCKERFSKNLEDSLLALAVPEEEPAQELQEQ